MKPASQKPEKLKIAFRQVRVADMVQTREVMSQLPLEDRPPLPAPPSKESGPLAKNRVEEAGGSQREILTHQAEKLEDEKGVTYCDLEADDASFPLTSEGGDDGCGSIVRDPSIACISTKDGL